jgi:hypothetical protein
MFNAVEYRSHRLCNIWRMVEGWIHEKLESTILDVIVLNINTLSAVCMRNRSWIAIRVLARKDVQHWKVQWPKSTNEIVAK